MTVSDGSVPLVDAHFHIYTTDLPLARGAWHRPPEHAGVDKLLSVLDTHGVLLGVAAAASLHGHYNDHVRAALKQNRRLRATAIVPPDISVYELERMKDDGFVGIRFMWRRLDDPPDLGAPEYQLLLRRVADLGWHVHLIERPERLQYAMTAIERSGARLMIDHMGLPDPAQGLSDPGFKLIAKALENGRTWVKLSAGYRLKSPDMALQFARELVRITDGERLVWGSDWPFAAFENVVTYADTLAAFREWVPDERLRRRIGGRNPLEFYFA